MFIFTSGELKKNIIVSIIIHQLVGGFVIVFNLIQFIFIPKSCFVSKLFKAAKISSAFLDAR